MDELELLTFVRQRMEGMSELFVRAREDPEAARNLRRRIAHLLANEGLAWERSERERLADFVACELAGFGPIQHLLEDEEVTEVMVNGPGAVYVERNGRLERVPVTFRDEVHLMAVVERMVAPLGRRLDQLQPLVDARLPDGARVNVVIPPIAVRGPYVTIRKFRRRLLSADELVRSGTCSEEMLAFLTAAVRSRYNVVVAGGTGSGKTTLLNVLGACIPEGERVVTIEDSAELNLQRHHVVSLEARAVNAEGKGEVTIRTLLRNALRMRPDRIVIGEVRGPEAFDLIQALNTGHDGSLTTVHANGPRDAVERLAAMALLAGENVPYEAILRQLVSATDLLVQQARFYDGSRRIVSVAAVDGGGSAWAVREIFRFEPEPAGGTGRVSGRFRRLRARLPARLEAKAANAGLGSPAAAEVVRRCVC